MNKAVFLDRDGTVSLEMGYIHEKDLPRYALNPGAAEGMRKLSAAGYKLCLTTNQSGLARGYYPVSQVDAVHEKLTDLLAAQEAALDAIFYCPHHPEPFAKADSGDHPEGMAQTHPVAELAVECDCRKPKAGMAYQGQKAFDLDLSQCWVVGDKNADLGFAQNFGGRGVLVTTGYGKETLEKLKAAGKQPQFVANSLDEAADIILAADLK